MFSNQLCLLCNEEMRQELSWKSVFLKVTEKVCCETCNTKFERITGDRCRTCSRTLADSQDSLCYDCIRWEHDSTWSGCLSSNHSLFIYNDFLKEIIAKYKYRGDYAIAGAFAPYLKQYLAELEFDCLVPIPLSAERLRERGFNQAKGLAKMAGYSCQELLMRTHSEKQSKKSRHERIHAQQVFQLCSEEVQGKQILLLDDIYTTGSTLRQAAKVLKLAGAEEIKSLTVAR
ncbi:ComF family protein [Peribacillus psychrosaccharolyticus]|uniref:ComF family protein n=1 Tax=Peribacillus psychrosaccharolyticus TaxID=1407 RepID=UPI003D2BEB4C